jgi:hypothetical protein
VTEANAIGANNLLAEIRLVYAEARLANSQPSEARGEAEAAIALATTAGDRHLEANGWRLVSQIALASGDLAAARQAVDRATAAMTAVTDELEQGRVAVQVARVLLREGDAQQARQELKGARDLFARLAAAIDLAAVDQLMAQAAQRA